MNIARRRSGRVKLMLCCWVAIGVGLFGCLRVQTPEPPKVNVEEQAKLEPQNTPKQPNGNPVSKKGPAAQPDNQPVDAKKSAEKDPGGKSRSTTVGEDPDKSDPVANAGEARRFALLVGVTEYKSGGNDELNDLLYPDADVEALAEVLVKRGYRKTDVIVLNSGRGKSDPKLLPTAAVIDDHLNVLLKKAGPNDVVLIALSGHGYQPRNGQAQFCAYQSKPSTNKGMVAVEKVVSALSKSSAGMRMLFVDACRDSPGERAVKRDFSEGFDTTASTGGEGVIAFYSCSKGERSWELDVLKHGVFFDTLIKALDGRASVAQDGKVTWSELVTFVNREINFHNQAYKRKQTPHFKGETTRNIPLVEFAVEGVPVAEIKLSANEILREDFSLIKDGQLPRGWEGDGFEKKFDDANKRHCVELRKPDGIHWLTPVFPKALSGDFIVEMEFKLHADPYARSQWKHHHLHLCFQGEDGYVLPVMIDPEGFVHFPESTPRKTNNFIPAKINRMRLIREGNSYNVSLNDGDAASTTINYQGAFESLRIGIVGAKFADVCRFYSIKAALIENKQAVAAPAMPQFGKTLLFEDFRRQNLGAVLPVGWTGEGFSLTTDERYQRRCLEVNKPNPQVYWLTLPPLDKTITDGGDFYVEFECLLLGDAYANPPLANHQVHVRLEGERAKPFHALIDYTGELHVDGNQAKKFSSFILYAPNRFRIIQKNGVFRFLCNQYPLMDISADRFPYDTLRLGLTGTNNTGFGGNLSARLYDVKVVSLPSRCEKLAKFSGLYQDFRVTQEGKAPPGWKASDLGGLAPIESRFLRFSRMAFTSDETPKGILESPAVNLSGNFQVQCDFAYRSGFRQEFGGLNIGLGGTKTGPLVVMMAKVKDDFFLQANGFPPVKITTILKVDESNVLLIERKESVATTKIKDKKGKETVVEKTDAFFGFTLNGQRLGVIPALQATGPFERIRLEAGNTCKGRMSSQIHKVVASTDAGGNP
jgi:hypothetical protein